MATPFDEVTRLQDPSPPPLGRPMSTVIRERVKASKQRFFANDNISAFIHSDAEREALQAEVSEKMEALLRSLVIDVDNDHNTRETAKRVAKMYTKEVFGGRYAPMPSVTAFPNVERINELVVVGPITVRSACSHHFCPIMGKLWIGIMPDAESSLIGLSKYARIADWIMSRPQIQEEAVKALADTLEEQIQPAGLALKMQAEHFCMHWRGVKDQSSMTSSVMRGVFLQSDGLRREFLSLAK
jgi:GTP cyclohydrolase I